jgi:hypothetical protein
MQAVAYVGMTVSYVSKDGAGEGLKKVFDGKHPCELCRVIAKAEQDQKKQAPAEHGSLPAGKGIKIAKEWPFIERLRLPDVDDGEASPLAFSLEMMLPGCDGLAPPVPPPQV